MGDPIVINSIQRTLVREMLQPFNEEELQRSFRSVQERESGEPHLNYLIHDIATTHKGVNVIFVKRRERYPVRSQGRRMERSCIEYVLYTVEEQKMALFKQRLHL